MASPTLNRPHPEHQPSVGRIALGRTWNGGQTYGTTLRCSCGHRFGAPHDRNKVSNEAPSKGGRAYAQSVYQRHVAEVEGA